MAYDTKCSICGQSCCVNCLHNGDWQQCVETKFAECSKCGHPSNQHYAAEHLESDNINQNN